MGRVAAVAAADSGGGRAGEAAVAVSLMAVAVAAAAISGGGRAREAATAFLWSPSSGVYPLCESPARSPAAERAPVSQSN